MAVKYNPKNEKLIENLEKLFPKSYNLLQTTEILEELERRNLTNENRDYIFKQFKENNDWLPNYHQMTLVLNNLPVMVIDGIPRPILHPQSLLQQIFKHIDTPVSELIHECTRIRSKPNLTLFAWEISFICCWEKLTYVSESDTKTLKRLIIEEANNPNSNMVAHFLNSAGIYGKSKVKLQPEGERKKTVPIQDVLPGIS